MINLVAHLRRMPNAMQCRYSCGESASLSGMDLRMLRPNGVINLPAARAIPIVNGDETDQAVSDSEIEASNLLQRYVFAIIGTS